MAIIYFIISAIIAIGITVSSSVAPLPAFFVGVGVSITVVYIGTILENI